MSGLEVTQEAVEYLSGLIEKQPEGTNVRLYITKPGTPTAETCLAFAKPGTQLHDDLQREYEGFSMFIEKTSDPFLEDAKIDFASDRLGGQLTIKAPNAKLPQVDENSSIEERVNYYLTTEINPGLASHGGHVNLVGMDEEVAVLQFGGGCQGCSAVDLTLKDGVENTLMQYIPQLKGVRDVTDHSDTSEAYYK